MESRSWIWSIMPGWWLDGWVIVYWIVLSCFFLGGGLLSCHLFWQQQIILILSPIFSPRSHTHTYKYEFGVQIQSGKCVTRRVKNGPFLASKTHQSNTSTWPTTTSTTIPPLQIQIQNWNSNTISKSLLKVFNLSYKLRSTHKKQFFFFLTPKDFQKWRNQARTTKTKQPIPSPTRPSILHTLRYLRIPFNFCSLNFIFEQ